MCEDFGSYWKRLFGYIPKFGLLNHIMLTVLVRNEWSKLWRPGWLIKFGGNCANFKLLWCSSTHWGTSQHCAYTECHMDGAILLAAHKSLCWDTEAIQASSVFSQQPRRHSVQILKGPFRYNCTSQSLLSAMRSPYTGLIYNGPVLQGMRKE